jgi:hypothetical protein
MKQFVAKTISKAHPMFFEGEHVGETGIFRFDSTVTEVINPVYLNKTLLICLNLCAFNWEFLEDVLYVSNATTGLLC